MGVVVVDHVRCWLCGRVIEDEDDIAMGNVSHWAVGSWLLGSQERVAFHVGCWEAYRRRERRQNIAAGVILLAAVLIPLAIAIFRFGLF